MIDDDPRIDPDELRRARFPGSSRRYDAKAVDRFLRDVAARVEATNALIDDLAARAQAAEEPTATSTEPAPVLTDLGDDQLVSLVGEEMASVLTAARRAAEDIRSKAEDAAARVIREATRESSVTIDNAKDQVVALTSEATHARDAAVKAAEADAERIRQEAERDAHRLLAEAREEVRAEMAGVEARGAELQDEAARALAEAREEGRSMVAEAKEVRGRVLDDLQRRRDAARLQIETLRTGREKLLDAYASVRRSLDEITGELQEAGADLDASASAPARADDGAPSDAIPLLLTAPMPDEHADDDDRDVDTELVTAADVETDAEAVNRTEEGPDDDEVDDTVAPVTPGGSSTEAASATARPTIEEVADETDAAGAPTTEDPATEDPADEDPATEDPADDTAPSGPADRAPTGDDPDDLLDLSELDPAPGTASAVPATTSPDDDPAAEVEAMFARLRAERAESVARAHEILEERAAAQDAADDGVSVVPATAEGADAPTEAGDDTRGDDPPGDTTPAALAAGRPASLSADAVPAGLLADSDTLSSRHEALQPLETALARAIKRRLADEQNEVLDLLRRTRTTDLADLLPSLSDHVADYALLARPILLDAAAAGILQTHGSPDAIGAVDLDHMARAVGEALVEPFRRRVERAIDDVGGDVENLDERLRSLYREWKVSHVATVTTDSLLTAHARGVFAGAAEGVALAWRIDPEQGPCPDAQDNALAGAVPRGEAFPTGDLCPQAHSGCRCLLVIPRT